MLNVISIEPREKKERVITIEKPVCHQSIMSLQPTRDEIRDTIVNGNELKNVVDDSPPDICQTNTVSSEVHPIYEVKPSTTAVNNMENISAVTNFSIRDFYWIRTNEEEDLCDFKIILCDGTLIATERLTATMFRSGLWYKKYARLTCCDFSKLQKNLESICGYIGNPVFFAYKTPGWYKEADGWHYITNQEDLYDVGRKIVILENPVMTISASLSRTEQATAAEYWQMKCLTHTGTASIVMRFVILASLFSLFSEAGFTPKGLLMIVGERSSMKTSLAMVMAELVDRRLGAEPTYNFECTQTSIDEASGLYKDCCLIVDDFHPAEDACLRKKMAALLEHITRMYGQSIQKQRSRRSAYGGLKAPEGMAILTGECYTGESSSMTRRLHLELEQGDVDVEWLTYYQNNLGILPNFLYNFERFCMRNQAVVLSKIIQSMQEYRQVSRDRYSASRYAEFFAFLMTADDLLLDYMRSVRCFGDDESMVEHNCFGEILDEVLQKNDEMQNVKNPIEQIRETIISRLEEGVEQLSSSDMSQIYIEDDFIWIKPEYLLALVKQYAESQGFVSAIANVPYMTSVLKRSGWLIKVIEAGKNRYTFKIPGAFRKKESGRFYKIDRRIANI